MNYIRYKCARCGAKLESLRELQGRTDRCPNCNQVNAFRVNDLCWTRSSGRRRRPSRCRMTNRLVSSLPSRARPHARPVRLPRR